MSYAALLTAGSDGQLSTYTEYRNSYGFLFLIWDLLAKKYQWEIEAAKLPKDPLDFQNVQQLWKWVASDPNPKLQPWEINTLVMSYDRAYLKGKENILLYADSVEKFSDALVPVDARRVNHLPQIAKDLREAVEEGAEYIAWYGMSVGENLFYIRVEEYNEEGDLIDEEADGSGLLCFLDPKGMEKVKPSQWKMVPLTEPAGIKQCCEEG
jgi:hypothetical protein